MIFRPICPACKQNSVAINYVREGVTHYRSRCSACVRRGRRARPQEPRWKTSGYRKKLRCDRCGFTAKYGAQIMVYHVDGDLTNTESRNLKSVCQNCAVEIARSDLPWRPGDLEPDR
jgi:hypothetical protein